MFGLDFPHTDNQIALWMSLADDNLSISTLIFECGGLPVRIVYFAGNQCRDARAAGTVAAAVGKPDTVMQSSIQDGFIPFGSKLVSACFNRYTKSH